MKYGFYYSLSFSSPYRIASIATCYETTKTSGVENIGENTAGSGECKRTLCRKQRKQRWPKYYRMECVF